MASEDTCSRCRRRRQTDLCVYRARPFRRRNQNDGAGEPGETSRRPENVSTSLASSPPGKEAPNASSLLRHYPNPGYLGMSSHSTIFNQVSSSTVPHGEAPEHDARQFVPPLQHDSIEDWHFLEQATSMLGRLYQLDISQLARLVQSWLERGVNLPLAEPFVAYCSEAATEWTAQTRPPRSSPDYHSATRNRVNFHLQSTQRPITVRQESGFPAFVSQIVGENFRLEALGIFLTAAARAALDTSFFPSLFTSDRQRRTLIRALSFLGDSCLETCLGLDCLNDLQLVLQYENFILHSQVDGDQSYHSWRRMGDVASSLFALGYHEKVNEEVHNIPTFIAELRRACFARIYAADKSLAIFLGRPPRIVKEYCHLQLPALATIPTEEETPPPNHVTQSTSPRATPMTRGGRAGRAESINYTADTRCAAVFASLKEEILLMFRASHLNKTEKISELQERVEQQWQQLPAHFRLSGSLKDCECSPFERDFLAGTRLDYLHTLLLLGLVTQKRASDVDRALLEEASEMLSITVQVVILRDRLVNSGTCLIWKVAQYGLPAAGIVSLALLHPITTGCTPFPRSRIVQDLSALVAEITIGAWIQTGEPNFALFSRATQTILSLLDSLTAWKAQPEQHEPHSSHANEMASLTEDWNAFIDSHPWEFEMDFWASLAEHPTLVDA